MNRFKQVREMTSKPDKIFKDQLEHYRKTPPPNAWNRIEGNLHKKKNNSFRLIPMAAAFILLASSFTLWFALQSPTVKPATVINQPEQKEEVNPLLYATPKIIEEQENSPEPNEPVSTSHHITSVKPVLKKNADLLPSSNEIVPVITTIENVVVISENEDYTPHVVALQGIEAKTEQTSSVPEFTENNFIQPKKIFYSASDVNSRFLKKKNVITPEIKDKPESGFQKILDFAGNLNYETAYGEVRQMKNEIFSIPVKGPKGN